MFYYIKIVIYLEKKEAPFVGIMDWAVNSISKAI